MKVVVLTHAMRKDDEMSVHVDMPAAMEAIELAIRRALTRRGGRPAPRRVLNRLAKGQTWDAVAAWREWTDYDEDFLVEEHEIQGYPRRRTKAARRR